MTLLFLLPKQIEMNRFKSILVLLFIALSQFAFSQEEDLLSLIEEDETRNFITSSFKANRVVNLHSLENTAGGELDIKISHRFGFLSGGIYELFGLDQASIRIGGDYGVTDQLMVGFGRSSYEKTFDGFIKYKFLRQSTGSKNVPITMAGLTSMAIKTLKPSDPTRENYFSSNLYYTFQLIMGRKFSEGFSLQLSPTLVH